MANNWGGPDQGDEQAERAVVAGIVFDETSAETATTRLHNRHPRADERRVAILVRRARQQRNAGRIDEVNQTIHELAVLGIGSRTDHPAAAPAPRRRRRWFLQWWS